jgi:hypothetical protein
VLEGAGTGRAQRAYQVLVIPDDCRPNSGDDPCWDSGRIDSSASADIVYAGLPLAAGGRYRWKVRVWDEARLVSGWSEPGWFEVELDRTDGWHASWIGLGRFRGNVTPPAQAGPPDPVAKALNPAPYLRRAFTVDQPVAAARLYVTALGLYEARLNGRRVGDAVLAPGWTDYARRIPYLTYDVTGLLAEGDNVLGAILADGWYSDFYGFDASGWRPVRVRDRDATPLVADPGPPGPGDAGARAALHRHRLLGLRRRADGRDRRRDRAGRRGRGVPGAVVEDPVRVRGGIRGRRRPDRLGHPDRLRT